MSKQSMTLRDLWASVTTNDGYVNSVPATASDIIRAVIDETGDPAIKVSMSSAGSGTTVLPNLIVTGDLTVSGNTYIVDVYNVDDLYVGKIGSATGLTAVTFSSPVYTNLGELIGPGLDGTDGTSGSSGTSGTDGTSGTSGTDGTSGSSGTDGTSGSSGTSGTDGTSGSSGTSGTDGTSGSSGIDGTSGSSGIDGTSGSSGIDGTSGSSGIDGTSGSSGISGTDGTSGSSGTDGVSGTDGTSGSSGTDGTSGSSGTDGVSGTDGTSGSSGIDGTSGILAYDVTNISAEYTGLTSDQYIRASGSSYNIYLPATSASGKLLIVKNIATGTITLVGIGGDLIDGVATKEIATGYNSLSVVDVATGYWEII